MRGREVVIIYWLCVVDILVIEYMIENLLNGKLID